MTQSLDVCQHLGKAVSPGFRDPRKSWFECERGHGVVCSCQCSACPDHSERPQAQAQPDAALGFNLTPALVQSALPHHAPWLTQPMSVERGQLVEGWHFVVATNVGREASLAATVESCRKAGVHPTVVTNAAPNAGDYDRSSHDYQLVLQEALKPDGVEWVVILEDDVEVSEFILDNTVRLPRLKLGDLPFMSLFMPDTIQDPFEPYVTSDGVVTAKRHMVFSNQEPWSKHRLWGSQGYCFRVDLARRLLADWFTVSRGQDARVMALLHRYEVPLCYSLYPMVQHRIVGTNFSTPPAYAAYFGGRRNVFEPTKYDWHFPYGVAGWLTPWEGKHLAGVAGGVRVLELGGHHGRSTLCMAQVATQVVSVDSDAASQAVAGEWVRRWGLQGKVRLVNERITENSRYCPPDDRFEVVFIDSGHDFASVWRDLEVARKHYPFVIAVHDYPDPVWPEVRHAVDMWATANRWTRVDQVDYLGVFEPLPAKGD